MVIHFVLSGGTNSDPITLPTDTPVFIIGTSITNGDRGTGFISVVHNLGSFIEWSGVNSTTGGAPTTTGGFGSSGTMLSFDFNGTLTLKVVDADHFVVANTSGGTARGCIWILQAPGV
jgi:hypothetical protein